MEDSKHVWKDFKSIIVTSVNPLLLVSVSGSAASFPFYAAVVC